MTVVVFFICLLKYLVFNVWECFPVYGTLNRIISWVFILPLILYGLFLSIQIVAHNIKFKKLRDFNNYLILPFIAFVVYFFFIKGRF